MKEIIKFCFDYCLYVFYNGFFFWDMKPEEYQKKVEELINSVDDSTFIYFEGRREDVFILNFRLKDNKLLTFYLDEYSLRELLDRYDIDNYARV